MYFPEQLATNKILGRFPVIPSIVEQIKNPMVSSILLTDEASAKVDIPGEKQLAFYRTFMLDRKNQLDLTIPVILEIVKISDTYDNKEALNLQVGDFWALSLVAGHSLGLDVEIDEDKKETYFLYFILDNPKPLYYKVDKNDAADIIAKYFEEDEFLLKAEQTEIDMMRELAQNNLASASKMPEIKLTNPASKIYTM